MSMLNGRDSSGVNSIVASMVQEPMHNGVPFESIFPPELTLYYDESHEADTLGTEADFFIQLISLELTSDGIDSVGSILAHEEPVE